MRKYIKTVIFGSSLLLLTTGLYAQANPDRDPYNQPMPNNNLVDQVRTDLNQTMDMGHLRGWQRGDLARANHDLVMFERREDRGHFSSRELDEAIGRIQNVANSDRLNGDQRAMLQRDVDRLQNVRTSGIVYSSNENPNYRTNGYYDRFGNWHPNK